MRVVKEGEEVEVGVWKFLLIFGLFVLEFWSLHLTSFFSDFALAHFM